MDNKEAFWTQGGSIVALTALCFALLRFFLRFALLFDYADHGVRIPWYIDTGAMAAIPAALLLLAVTAALCRTRGRAPKLLTAAGLLLLGLCVWGTAATALFIHTSPIGDHLPISTVKARELSAVPGELDGLLYLGLLDDRDLYALHADLETFSNVHSLRLETAVLTEQLSGLSPALRETLETMGVTWLPAVVRLEDGAAVQVFNGTAGLWEALG